MTINEDKIKTGEICNFWFGCGVPVVPVPGVLFKGGDESVEIGQLLQFGDVVPREVQQPRTARVVHLVLAIQDHASSQKEIEFIHVQFARRLQDLAAHVK